MGTMHWKDAVETEIKMLNAHKTFWPPNPGDDLSNCQLIPCHFVFAIKYDGQRRRARLVAAGNFAAPIHKEDSYSSVVGVETV